MSQPLLSNRTIESIPGMTNADLVKYPTLPPVILTQDKNGHERKKH